MENNTWMSYAEYVAQQDYMYILSSLHRAMYGLNAKDRTRKLTIDQKEMPSDALLNMQEQLKKNFNHE
jgi:hypothetical protein